MRNYTLLLLPLSGFRQEFRQQLFYFIFHHFIKSEEVEILYDWTVNEVLHRIMVRKHSGGVENHYTHDTYRCFYDNARFQLESYLENVLREQNFHFVRFERIKTLVAGDTLIIARGMPEHVRI